MMNLARHGDLSFRTVKEIPTGANKKDSGKSVVLAEGEQTGHHHTLITSSPVDVYEMDDSMFFTLDGEGEITHQEHDTIKLEPGTYEVKREREYDYFSEEINRVQD